MAAQELVHNLEHRFNEIMQSSSFLATLAKLAPAAKREENGDELRGLTEREIEQLEAQQNVCEDWRLLRVVSDFDPAHIVGNMFRGRCVLGRFTKDTDTRVLPTGVYFSTIVESRISNEARIHRCPLISGYVVEQGAFVLNSTLTMPGSSTFGNGTKLSPGLETGGRELIAYADLDYDTAVELTRNAGDAQLRRVTNSFIETYVESCRLSHGYVGGYAGVTNCAAIDGAWIGAGSKLESAAGIHNSTLLSTPEEACTVTGGALVRNSILHWGVRVDSGAIVEDSVMLEYSGAEKHAKITECVICPNSAIGEGEVTASFVGPFVGFHHQALLIATYWPEGRGNVGYGANVGSNHTSRVADQELMAGEGMFFGLACSVKFPANFIRAPYTIIATGVTTLPQRMELPFSLIVEPTTPREDVPPALNRLIPAWVLSDNLYAVMRNHQKFAARNKARRTTFDLSVFREETVALMEEAASRLESATGQEIYREADIPGIGKNYITDADRKHGAETYRRFVTYTRRSRTREELAARHSAGEDPRHALSAEERATSREALTELTELITAMREILAASREKDQRRGRSIIDDYDATHPGLDDDEFLLATGSQLHQEQQSAQQLLEWLSVD